MIPFLILVRHLTRAGQRLTHLYLKENINTFDKKYNDRYMSMSRELQEKADKIMRELLDMLVPIKEEIKILKNSSDYKNLRIQK